MKRFVSIVLSFIMLVSLSPAFAEKSLTVVATTFPLYDIAKTICGDKMTIQYARENTYEMAKEADVLFCIGGEADAWADTLENVVVIKAIEDIPAPIENDDDILTIPINCILVATNLTQIMNEMDQPNKELYSAYLWFYVEEMLALDQLIRETVKEGTKIACDDGSMAYFANEYRLEYVSDDKEAVVISTYNLLDTDVEASYPDLMRLNIALLSGENH